MLAARFDLHANLVIPPQSMRLAVFGASLFAALILHAFCHPTASARVNEPGQWWAGGLVGPSLRLGSTLGGSTSNFTLSPYSEYILDSNWSIAADLSLGIAQTVSLSMHAGPRYRFGGFGLPVLPYTQIQVAFGGLLGVIGANLPFYGLRPGLGLDYMLSAHAALGGVVAVLGGFTGGSRSAFYGTVDVLFYATYMF